MQNRETSPCGVIKLAFPLPSVTQRAWKSSRRNAACVCTSVMTVVLRRSMAVTYQHQHQQWGLAGFISTPCPAERKKHKTYMGILLGRARTCPGSARVRRVKLSQWNHSQRIFKRIHRDKPNLAPHVLHTHPQFLPTMTEAAPKRMSQYVANCTAYLRAVRRSPWNSCGEANWETGKVTSNIRTGRNRGNVDMERWVENARARLLMVFLRNVSECVSL